MSISETIKKYDTASETQTKEKDCFYFDLSTHFGGRYRDPAIRGDWPNG